ncbi:uncharacterized protein [Paramormyrops kingsleyae]|uniref:uncharacterized protein isoform X3 n=1 Tax=Paramormyrops kingsleyae TaxID=1676925 RepID=UPI003B977672
MRKEGWLRMSQETASPLKTGSSVRDGLLLFNEGCGSADRPADSEGRPGTIASAEEFPEPRGHVTTGSSTNGDLVRNQPEPVDLGAGKGVGGVLHGPTTRPKKHPVSHRVQHKLRSVGGDRGHSVDSLPEGLVGPDLYILEPSLMLIQGPGKQCPTQPSPPTPPPRSGRNTEQLTALWSRQVMLYPSEQR